MAGSFSFLCREDTCCQFSTVLLFVLFSVLPSTPAVLLAGYIPPASLYVLSVSTTNLLGFAVHLFDALEFLKVPDTEVL